MAMSRAITEVDCLCGPLVAERPARIGTQILASLRQHRMRNLAASIWNSRAVAVSGALVLSVACGCGPSISAVSGVVTLDGSPLPNARVILTPVGGAGRPAQATTDDSGKFAVTSIKPGDGAYRGEYKVTFSLIEDDAIDLTKMTVDPNEDARQRAAAALEKARQATEKKTGRRNSLLHANYTKIDTTPFTIKVPISGALNFKLNKLGTAE
jgi:Carboxypeptidase regulatory-like domain